MMPSRFGLAINSSCEPVPLVRLQNPHGAYPLPADLASLIDTFSRRGVQLISAAELFT